MAPGPELVFLIQICSIMLPIWGVDFLAPPSPTPNCPALHLCHAAAARRSRSFRRGTDLNQITPADCLNPGDEPFWLEIAPGFTVSGFELVHPSWTKALGAALRKSGLPE